MISLDRGALEASYATGKYSDVLMTPDFRILISGPGQTDLKIRVSPKGDTCLDNHGADAPYVTVTSLLEGGLYRVQPNQRVLFEHGSLNEVVDNETEPCGCPPATLEAAKPVGGPSSTPADTAFPIAQSEGLAKAPPPPTTPAVPAGEATPRSPSRLSTKATRRHRSAAAQYGFPEHPTPKQTDSSTAWPLQTLGGAKKECRPDSSDSIRPTSSA